jgi:Galactose oxidase, central domain
MGIAAIDDKIHLFGGRTADLGDNLDRHDVYDFVTDRWTEAAPLPRARSAGAYTVLDILIIYGGEECKPGGEAFSANAFDDVTAYDVRTDRWIALESLPQARHAFGGATIGDIAYFAGGAPVTDVLSLSLLRK